MVGAFGLNGILAMVPACAAVFGLLGSRAMVKHFLEGLLCKGFFFLLCTYAMQLDQDLFFGWGFTTPSQLGRPLTVA